MADRKSNARTERRVPMGTRADATERADRGRTTSSDTPVTVRNLTAGESVDRTWLRQRLGFKLGKFAMHIDRTSVVLRDESGPLGAPVVRATIKLSIPNHDAVTIVASGASAKEAISTALRAAERTLRRGLERERGRRLTPATPTRFTRRA